MESNASVVPQDQGVRKGAWALKAIAVLFVVTVIYAMSGDTVSIFSAFASLGGPSVLEVYIWQAWMYLGFLILSVIEAVGLWKRCSWARWFGIVLGILILAPDILIYYAFGSVAITQVLSTLLLPTNLIVLAVIVYLAIPKKTDNWESSGTKPAIFVTVLAMLEIALIAAYLYYSHTVALPLYEANDEAYTAQENTIAAAEFRETVPAGTPYKNKEYGFSLVFPKDENIYVEDSIPGESNIGFVPKGTEGDAMGSFGGFGLSTYQAEGRWSSLDTIPPGDPRDKILRGTINGYPYTEDDYYTGRNSITYVFVENGSVFEFLDSGGMPRSDFDTVMQTIGFTMPEATSSTDAAGNR